MHWFIGIHGGEARRVKARQPHVAHDHDAKWVFAVFESVGEFAALFFVADVRLPFGAIVRAAGHDDFDDTVLALFLLGVIILGACPIWPQLDQRLIEVNTDTATHANYHGFAVHGLLAFLKMRYQVLRNQCHPLRVTHQRF